MLVNVHFYKVSGDNTLLLRYCMSSPPLIGDGILINKTHMVVKSRTWRGEREMIILVCTRDEDRL